jgi:hypothetical protein
MTIPFVLKTHLLPSRGHANLDAATEMDVKRDILLERFQEEVHLFTVVHSTSLIENRSTQALTSGMQQSMAW